MREPLDGNLDPVVAARWLRGDPRAVALIGAWAGGGALLTSHPVAVVPAQADPFQAIESAPVELDGGESGDSTIMGGGWFGWLGFDLARRVETLPPPGRRPVPMPPFDLAFHDHVIRCDAEGRWWFEALWSSVRARHLRERLDCWRARLATEPPPPRPFTATPLRPAPPGVAGHRAAVAETVARIHAGDMSQANICLRLDADYEGDPLDLWLGAVAAARPAYAAYVAGRGHAIAGLSPELFLRRRARVVTSRPIKGTAPLSTNPSLLATSAKDRAENVMIVDLMRNDLGRVCTFGSVTVDALCQVEPAAGVWHLVSTVSGELRAEIGDGRLLRATFPPGSVTGAPKVQALRTIHELEPTRREAYCGAIGFASPCGGLELSVAIRTIELRSGRMWLGAGGGIVADSSPEHEAAEALAKARGIADAAGLAIEPADATEPSAWVPPSARLPIVRLARPDPDRGVIETISVARGRARRLDAHLARLRAACDELGLEPPDDLEAAVTRAAAGLGDGGLRVHAQRTGITVAARQRPALGPTLLVPAVLPGGLGRHKWADRALIDALSGPGHTPLFCDLDGTVLEAGYAAVLVAREGTLLAPALDGRLLDSISRREALAAAERLGVPVRVGAISLADLGAAEAIVLTSSLRGPHPGRLGPDGSLDRADELCARLRRTTGSVGGGA